MLRFGQVGNAAYQRLPKSKTLFVKYAHVHISNFKLAIFPSGGHGLLGHHEQYRKIVAGFL